MIDPTSRADVEAVLKAVVSTMGTDGLVDLLARLPGVRVEAATPKRFLSSARPGRVHVGPEDQLVLSDPLVRVQVVGGVELHRQPLRAGEVADVVAAILVRHTRDEGCLPQSAAVLEAAREATSGF